mmetsp:Transcript_41772/g.55044  ORF Transcript_41772/g.55044 Transcript_41772/m.55044 type:complete len:107 (-) Transcript_41772:46-366(-)
MHRETYYPICRKSYSKIMECYENPRQTNEESDACAVVHRDLMQKLQNQLTSQLMGNCKWLEECTDTCKNAEDMACINRCGDQYLGKLGTDFDSTLRFHARKQNVPL